MIYKINKLCFLCQKTPNIMKYNLVVGNISFRDKNLIFMSNYQ